MDKTIIVEKAKAYVLDILGNDSSGHDYFHSLRVYNLALDLAKDYHADNLIISLAALLHDLDDYKIANNTNHVISFLDENKVPCKNQVMDIINNMSFSAFKQGKTVTTIEGKIVQDADRLDALGAIGIARCFAYSGYKNRALYKGDKNDDSAIAHFYQKLLELPKLMNTSKARLLANNRVDFMKKYLQEFFQEWE